MLPDKSILIGQKLVENGKIQMQHFETMCTVQGRHLNFCAKNVILLIYGTKIKVLEANGKHQFWCEN